ncbi:hypothetical protein EDC04DRAFT_2898662 [Pisolithus marmoratus]|nr:hypothetical protein EDC04DRAFT_2898662 [Pisolithus marmoratus]
MAPGHCDDDKESQILPWASEPTSDSQVWPLFTVSKPGQTFGFKIPSQFTATSTNSTQSITSHSSRPSSISSSSVCGSNSAYETQDDMEDSQTAPQRWSLQHFSPPLVPPPKINMQLMTMAPPLPMISGNGEDEVCSAGDDLIIDDVSPSEDNRFAESIVHGGGGDTRHGSQLSDEHSQSAGSQPKDSRLSGPPTTQRGVEDVITQHRQHNCGPHLPDNVQLMTICSQQMSKAPHHMSHFDVGSQLSLTTDVIPSHPLPAATSTTSGRMSNANSDLSQLQFYSPSVHDILEHAKQISHCDLVAVNSFPLHADFSHKASEYIVKAIVECHSKGLLIPDGWWPHYTTGITKLEDLRNWHSSLKKKAHFFVCDHYKWDPQNCCNVNAGITRKLLECGDFLKDGVDEEGHTNNLAHPALSGLIIEFFYTGTKAMANIFPEVFQLEVPCPAVAPAVTVIKVALDEVVAKGKEVTFKCDVYADVYADILSLMAKCDMAPVHHAKMKACRMQWVKIGWNGSSAGTMTGFNVDLD